jgi:hypothetical protein
MRRPFFRSKEIAIVVGLSAFGLAWFALYDAYEARGDGTPKLLRPFTWW